MLIILMSLLTKEQLISELTVLRKRLAEFEKGKGKKRYNILC